MFLKVCRYVWAQWREGLADCLADTSGPKRRFYREIVILCTLGTSPQWGGEGEGVDGPGRQRGC